MSASKIPALLLLCLATPAAAETMSPPAFCAAVKQRITALAATCEQILETKYTRSDLQSSIDDDKCFYDLECPPDSACVEAVGSEAGAPKTCSPPIKVGTPCKMGSGTTCGASFYCKADQCARSGKTGGKCESSSECGPELICLRAKAKAPTGKCGPRRKAGEACHDYTECRGRCATPSKDVLDGTCVSMCDSH